MRFPTYKRAAVRLRRRFTVRRLRRYWKNLESAGWQREEHFPAASSYNGGRAFPLRYRSLTGEGAYFVGKMGGSVFDCLLGSRTWAGGGKTPKESAGDDAPAAPDGLFSKGGDRGQPRAA